MERFCLIHIGKCGGLSLSSALTKNNIDFEGIHSGYGEEFEFKNKKYVILIRNPIERYISSFNFTYERMKSWGCSRKFKRMMRSYGTLNNMAKELYKNGELNEKITKDINLLPHLVWNISVFLKPILEQCDKDNIIRVIPLHKLNEEAKQMFGLKLKRRNASKPKHPQSLHLCEESYNNLKIFLKEDYDCIQTLYDWGCLDENNYDILMK